MPTPFSFSGYGGKFAINRGYINGVCASWVNGSTGSLIGNIWRIQGVFGGVTTYQDIEFLPNFLAANTNRYTPDHLVVDCYYVNLPSPTHIPPLPINVSLYTDPVTLKVYLNLDSLGFPQLYFLDLPAPPQRWP